LSSISALPILEYYLVEGNSRIRLWVLCLQNREKERKKERKKKRKKEAFSSVGSINIEATFTIT
jgi:hypothetical protein